MNRQSKNQKTTRRFLALAIYCLSALLVTAQTATANDSFKFSTDSFALENLMNVNFLSPQSVFVVNTTGDQNDQIPGDGFCDDGANNCSLRAAIQEANAFSGANVIDFNIPGNCGTQTIMPTTPLPNITDSVTIDGYSQPGAQTNTEAVGENAVICVMVNGANITSPSFANGLVVAAVNTTIRGLAVGSFTDRGISVIANGGIIEGNFIGTNQTGIPVRANRLGITVQANNVLIGGTTLASRNIVKNSTRYGITLNQGGGSNTVQNNYISANGETGISIFRSGGNLIGGASAAARNVVSGNGTAVTANNGYDGSGINIYGDTQFGQSPNNTIQGNYVGTDAFGSGAFANKTNGIQIDGSINTTVTGNVVSGNTIDGIGISGAGATGNVIKGNTVGLDASRLNVVANIRDGVSIFQVGGNTVGGVNAGDGNYIAGNGNFGVQILGTGAENNSVLGNFVGFDAGGTARPQSNGIVLYAFNNIIGGTAAGARNYVAGTNGTGISINYGGGNVVSGNSIGLLPNGSVLGNNFGISLYDTINNTIGGTAAGAGNTISGNIIGVNLTKLGSATTGNQITGNLITSNTSQGIFFDGANSNTIGGTTAAARNIIAGNGEGVKIFNGASNNLVQGNYIGVKADGATSQANNIGVKIQDGMSSGNVIGGTATGAGNVISGNTTTGVQIQVLTNANRVEGNIIGLSADGSAAVPNKNGVVLSLASSNIIGGTAANAGNVISGNTMNGVILTDGANNNLVQGNKIGTDSTGTAARANGGVGVQVMQGTPSGTRDNTIGGTTAAARNVISANQNGGVQIIGSSSSNNTIAGNYIGIKADGTGLLSNNAYGIVVNSPNTIIGGATSASRNVISGQSGNAAAGIYVDSNSSGLNIQNNYIGTTADGSSAAGNFTGIQLYSDGVTIDSNVISANSFCGICVQAVANGGYIVNNKIGTNAAGTALLGNNQGLYLLNAANFKVGFDVNGNSAPNIIAGSTLTGIRVFGGTTTGNLFYTNSIYGNGELGIDLGNNGVTQNDNQDADTGANNLQNFPIINTATTTISGNFNSTPNRLFRLEFFSSPSADPTGYGEGQTFLVAQTVTTDASGNATFSVANPQPLGSYISATAIDTTTGDTSEFSAYKQTLAPTAVNFNGAQAKAFENGVLVEWQTGRETDNLGFNVYRERGGKRELLNKNLVAGSALTAQENLLSEQNYSWFDKDGDANSTYSIEAVDVSGAKQNYGGFQAETAIGKSSAANSAMLNQLGKNEAATTLTVEPTAKLAAKPSARQTEIQNTLTTAQTVKITVRRAGIYRATASELFANGLPKGANAANLKLFADGIEQPISVSGAGSDGVFNENSSIEFYGMGTTATETDARIYYLVAASNAGLRMAKSDSSAQPTTADFYTATIERRDRTIYIPSLLNGDDENFFGTVVNNAGTDQTINAAQIAANGGAAELEISLQGVTRTAHSVSVQLNGGNIAMLSFSEMERGTARVSLNASQLRDGENTVRLVTNNQNDASLVDFIRLTYPHRFQAENNQLNFTANGNQEISVGNFTSKNVRVFDVTNPDEPVELAANMFKSSTGNDVKNDASDLTTRNYAVRFTTVGTGTRRLTAIADDQMMTAASIALDNPSNLRDRRNQADLLIVTRREFFDALAPLVKLRTIQGLNVSLVDVADIYDEFSFGRKSTAAIKDFFNYAATNWRKKPQFVLLAGDATYDTKGYLGNSDADVVQTKMVDTDSVETASDEWLADFDGDDIGDLAIGRLPVRTVGEMNSMVEKLVNYERQNARSSATFIADTNDGYDFAAANQSVFSLLPQGIDVTDIRRENSNAKSQMLNAVNSGQSIVSYAGHGSNNLWRGNLLTNADAAALTNGDRLPMFVMMTCLNGYFQHPTTDSLSEALLKNPNGGAIAAWASTGTTTPDSQTELNRQFVGALYGQNLTVGQAVRAAKYATTNRTVRQTWTLLGDPTMRLK